MNAKILFLVVINCFSVFSNPYDIDHLMKREKYCGDRLWRAVSLVCKGNHNGPDKRIYNDIFNRGEYDDASYSSFEEPNIIFPFLEKSAVKSIIPSKFRKSYGIVNECCYNSCSREHLMFYCKPN